MIKLVTVTACKIEKLSANLTDCTKAVMTTNTSEHNTAVEQFTVVKHNWKSNVKHPFLSQSNHSSLYYTGSLLNTHVDDLTSRMATPLNKPYSFAVTINKTESRITTQQLVNQFAQMSDRLQENMNMLEVVFNETVSGLYSNDTVNAAGASINVMQTLTPHSIAAARSLIGNK